MIHDTQCVQISQKQDERNIYAIMKTMCPPGCHHNGFVATHALGLMNRTSCAQVHEHKAIVVITGRAHCFLSWLHIYIYIYIHTYIHTYIHIDIHIYTERESFKVQDDFINLLLFNLYLFIYLFSYLFIYLFILYL